jgi:MYXO-CTERM domain-containing protein
VGDLDPTRPGLEGWAIGQRSGYDWNYYDAKTGTVLRKYGPGTADMARGVCGDVDPTHLGYECWTNGKVWNNSDLNTAQALSSAPPTQIGSDAPGINFRIFWDGDLLSEVLDTNKITKWAYPGAPSGGFSSVTFTGGIYGPRNAAPLYGDMFGDWREEVLLEQSGGASMRIYSTAIPTDKRIYTLVHDPEYRNSMCEKGYIQSHMLDYYLGEGMTDPPAPKITYPTGTPSGPSGAAGAGGGATTGAAGAGGGGTTEAGGAGGGAAGGRGGRGGNTVGGGGTTGPGVTTVANTGGTPGTGGAAGGNPATAASTVGATGGSVVSGTGGATGVASETGGSTGSGAEGGAVGEESGSIAPHAAEGSGCSCAIGAASGHASAGYLVAMLGMLGVVLGRRRRR